MSLKWTILLTIAVGVLLVASFVLFEATIHHSTSQRQRVANVGWTVAGLLVVALWAWFFAGGRRGR